MNDLSPGMMAQTACLLEVSARKPGNVHRDADFRDLDHLDFLLAASAIAAPLDRARSEGIGAAVLGAVKATRHLVATNANLGMILLLAPMAAVPAEEELAAGLPRVLAATTIDDARLVYEAIRLANPGGLGRSDDQDVADEPTVTLLDAMRIAADRDAIARQYSNGYQEILGEGLPTLRRHLGAERPLETAIIGAYLELLSTYPDTLIARKLGRVAADEASARARSVLASGWPEGERSFAALQDLDDWLRSDGHRRNPGATADLTAAVLFAALRDGTIKLPRAAGSSFWAVGPAAS
ncbi:triphosphoribosyl-dephospho-CoA synthase [Paludisphaera rhizosphaerae]|uniref:triphosphoribosyl-dephospho-CoA synthase n=1 Tax=Paludisphaera rhizosphaerae TaxID=2711216 RepID=UPI0013ECA2A4|nr:triphosphoribosyl-dephospho-CoA synthase [Paludisphaera rhizosphaerae]